MNGATTSPTVTVTNPPALVMRDAILISVIVVLIILVVALVVMLTLLAFRKKLKQVCYRSMRKGQAKTHESEAVSALACEFQEAERVSKCTCSTISNKWTQVPQNQTHLHMSRNMYTPLNSNTCTRMDTSMHNVQNKTVECAHKQT